MPATWACAISEFNSRAHLSKRLVGDVGLRPLQRQGQDSPRPSPVLYTNAESSSFSQPLTIGKFLSAFWGKVFKSELPPGLSAQRSAFSLGGAGVVCIMHLKTFTLVVMGSLAGKDGLYPQRE